MVRRIPTEEEVSAWDLETALAYGRLGLSEHSTDTDELLLRRNILITSKLSNQSPLLREVVMLSIAANDTETAGEAIRWLESAGDPAMGYFAYKAMESGSDEFIAEEFLQSSARSGFFPAQRLLLDRKSKKHGIFAFPLFCGFRLLHSIKVFKVALHDPKDLRLR